MPKLHGPRLRTIKQAKETLATIGVTVNLTSYGEFRVNLLGGTEWTAYYTDSLEDAVGTGRAMWAHVSVPCPVCTCPMSLRDPRTCQNCDYQTDWTQEQVDMYQAQLSDRLGYEDLNAGVE